MQFRRSGRRERALRGRASTHSSPSVPERHLIPMKIRNRGPRSIAAAATVLGVAAISVLGVTAPASAASSTGYTELSWAPGADAQSMSAPMPGDLAGYGNATVTTGPGNTLLAAGGKQGQIASFGPGLGNCLIGMQAKDVKACGTGTVTVTFPQPVVNPVIAVATGQTMNTTGGAAGRCAVAWHDTVVTAVNGAAAGANRLEAFSVDPAETFDASANRISYTPSQAMSRVDCDTARVAPTGFTRVHIKGVVTSFTYTFIDMAAKIRETDANAPFALNPARSHVAPALPSADLSVEKTAPELVGTGSRIDWSITVTNNGPSDSHGFVVHDAVPAGITDVTLDDDGGLSCVVSGRDLDCVEQPTGYAVKQAAKVATVADITPNAGNANNAMVPSVLDAGASTGTIKLSGTAPTAGMIENTATVAGVDADNDVDNNTSTAETEVMDTLQSPIANPAIAGGAAILALAPTGVWYLRRRAHQA
jgi:uncharacterized repeat protein (TIGR01451 family)